MSGNEKTFEKTIVEYGMTTHIGAILKEMGPTDVGEVLKKNEIACKQKEEIASEEASRQLQNAQRKFHFGGSHILTEEQIRKSSYLFRQGIHEYISKHGRSPSIDDAKIKDLTKRWNLCGWDLALCLLIGIIPVYDKSQARSKRACFYNSGYTIRSFKIKEQLHLNCHPTQKNEYYINHKITTTEMTSSGILRSWTPWKIHIPGNPDALLRHSRPLPWQNLSAIVVIDRGGSIQPVHQSLAEIIGSNKGHYWWILNKIITTPLSSIGSPDQISDECSEGI